MSMLATWIALTASTAVLGQTTPEHPPRQTGDPVAVTTELPTEPSPPRLRPTGSMIAAVAPMSEVTPVPRPALSPPFHPLRIRWGITAPVLATTVVGFGVMEGLGGAGPGPMACSPPAPGTCPDLGALEPIDKVALGHHNDAAALASDAFVAAALLGPAVASMAESIAFSRAEQRDGVPGFRRRGAARFGYDAAIWSESIGVAMFTTNVLKAAFDRTRPLTHLGEDALMEDGVEIDGDFARSFPSGHATLAFSSVVAGAMLLTIKQCKPGTELRRSGTPRCAPRSAKQRTTLGLMWGLGVAGAVTTAVLRVVAGKHYPTDVLMGSAIGATSGIVIPLLHRRS